MKQPSYSKDFLLNYSMYHFEGDIDHIHVINYSLFSISYYIYDKNNRVMKPILKPEYEESIKPNSDFIRVYFDCLNEYERIYDREQKIKMILTETN